MHSGPTRLALFGGTFDPPHLGHLRIAAAAASHLALDRVLFAPTGRQPLKSTPPDATFAQRLAMTQLACDEANASSGEECFYAIALDAPHPSGQPNYTVDLLAALAEEHPRSQLFHIVGADSFLTLPQWRSPARLLTLAEWIIVSRPGSSLDDSQLRATLAAALHAQPSAQQIARLHLLTGIAEDISASELRQRLAAGQDTSALLPATVAEYIHQHHLYRAAPANS